MKGCRTCCIGEWVGEGTCGELIATFPHRQPRRASQDGPKTRSFVEPAFQPLFGRVRGPNWRLYNCRCYQSQMGRSRHKGDAQPFADAQATTRLSQERRICSLTKGARDQQGTHRAPLVWPSEC